jgi:hypothetical protein
LQLSHFKPLGFGEVLDGAFQIYRKHFVPLGLTTLIPSGVSALVTVGFVATTGSAPDAAGAAFALFMLFMMGVGVIMVAVWGSLAWQTSEAWIGGEVGFAEGMRAGFRSFWRMIGAWLVVSALLMVAYFAVAIPLFIVVAIIGVAAGAGGAGGDAAATVVGGLMVLLLIPAMLFAMVAAAGYLSFTLPAVVVEGLGPLRAVSRSFDLAKGAVLRTGGLVTVAMMIIWLSMVGVLMLTGGFNSLVRPDVQPSLGMLFVQQIGMMAVGAFTTPFVVAVITVAYYDRRVRTEALDVQLAANQLQVAEPAPL